MGIAGKILALGVKFLEGFPRLPSPISHPKSSIGGPSNLLPLKQSIGGHLIMNSQGSQLGKTSQLGKGTQVGKGPSQKGSKLGNFKAPKQIHPQSSRASTPDTQPNGQSDLSRDELARTVSAHGNRRRKRADVFESEGEEADDSPLGSPKRAVRCWLARKYLQC